MTSGHDYLDHGHRPGSRLDAQHQAGYHAGAADAGHLAASPAGLDFSSVVLHVSDVMPAETIPRAVALGAANPYLRILPRDIDRRRAVILAIDNDVLFTESEDLARQLATSVAGGATAASLLTGAYWSKGIPLPIESRDQMFVVATTQAGLSRVSVIVERYVRAYPPV